MASLERVVGVLEGKPVDRRPFILACSLYGARLTHCPLHTYYSDPQAYVRGQDAVRELLEVDILLGPFCLAMEGAAFGSQLHHSPHYAPTLRRPVIDSLDEVDRLTPPDVDGHPLLGYLRQAVRMLHQSYGNEVPVAASMLSPFDLPAMIMGIEVWLQAVMSDREAVRRIIALTLPHFVRLANAYLRDGAAFLVLPSMINSNILTRQLAQEVAIPVLREAFAQVQGPILFHTTGASILPMLDLLAGLPNVAGYVLSSDDDFAEVRKIVGPEPILIGNIDGPTLGRLQPEQIRLKCLALLREHAADRRFILATSQADIAYDTPSDCLLAFREAVGKAGKVE